MTPSPRPAGAHESGGHPQAVAAAAMGRAREFLACAQPRAAAVELGSAAVALQTLVSGTAPVPPGQRGSFRSGLRRLQGELAAVAALVEHGLTVCGDRMGLLVPPPSYRADGRPAAAPHPGEVSLHG